MSVLDRFRNRTKQASSLSSPVEDASYYKLSPTCQIPKLHMIYELYFGHKSDGCFVEVGAYDGEYSSNTSGLADIGWFGYYIEPVPEYFLRCKERHVKNKNIVVSQYAIGPKRGTVEINLGGPLSTISEDMKHNFYSLDWAKECFKEEKKIFAEQITLEDYLTKQEIKPGFELLVVDVEGYEWNVLHPFNISKWKPKMVIIELHDQNDDYLLIREECNNIVRYFKENGYKVIYKDFTNTVYVPEDSYPIQLKRQESSD